MTTPCMCGGCDSCLKDQGVLTEAQERAELAIYNIAHGKLSNQFDSLSNEAMQEVVAEAMASGAGEDQEVCAIIATVQKNHSSGMAFLVDLVAAVREHYISERIEDEIKRVRNEMSL